MRYEKYKKSISPFLEEIPFHWKETYLSHAYSLSSDTGHTEEQLLSVFLDKGSCKLFEYRSKAGS